MENNKLSKIILGALSLITANETLAHSSIVTTNKDQDSIATINRASLSSIERTWLKVPSLCKARAFNASPVVVKQEYTSDAIASLYSKYSV